MDGVRELSEMLFRTELEVERGLQRQEEEKEGLEWKLRTVAEEVSGRVGGGLLERVREFDGVLELEDEVPDWKANWQHEFM